MASSRPASVEVSSTEVSQAMEAYRYSRASGAKTVGMVKKLEQEQQDIKDFRFIIDRLGVERVLSLCKKYYPEEFAKSSDSSGSSSPRGHRKRQSIINFMCPCRCFGIND